MVRFMVEYNKFIMSFRRCYIYESVKITYAHAERGSGGG